MSVQIESCPETLCLQAALKIIRRDAEITKCYWDKWDSTWYGELGATSAILNAGYNIDSFIHR